MMLRTVHSPAGSCIDIVPMLEATVPETGSDSIDVFGGSFAEFGSASHSECGPPEVHHFDDGQLESHIQDAQKLWNVVGGVDSDASTLLYVESHHPELFQWH